MTSYTFDLKTSITPSNLKGSKKFCVEFSLISKHAVLCIYGATVLDERWSPFCIVGLL